MVQSVTIELNSYSPLRPQAAGFTLPAPNGCRAWFLLGGDVARSSINLVPGAGDATIVGNPDPQTFYLTMDGDSSYFILPFVDDFTFSAMVISRTRDTLADPAHRPVLFGNGDNGGFLVYNSSATVHGLTVYEDPSTSQDATVTMDPVEWRMCLADGNTSSIHIYDPKDGTSDSHVMSDRQKSVHNLRIGSSYTGASFHGESDIAAVGYWNRVLSSAERDAVYEWGKAYMTRRSVLTL